eukprot:2883669-Rhodomonas_salina.1
MSNPGPEHINAAKMILKYLAGTKHLKLTYRRSNAGTGNVLECYADADHAGDPDTRTSMTGYVLLGGHVTMAAHGQLFSHPLLVAAPWSHAHARFN